MNLKKKITAISIVIALLLLVTGWGYWCSPTRIAFVNYQVISLGQISKANDNAFIKIKELGTEQLPSLKKYDMVFINAMGLRITEAQREEIKKAARKGTPILSTYVTNPANDIVSLEENHADTLKRYLQNGGRRNYRNMLHYVRKYVDRKKCFVREPETVVPSANDLLYHTDSGNRDEEELGFNSIREYHDYLKRKKLWKEEAPRVIVTGPMGDPTDLIAALEASGNRVYPVRWMERLLKGHHIDSILPHVIINMAHGRMGDATVAYLAQHDVLLFAPLNVNRLVEKWEDDKMGMNGGFLSQSVVTPEIDGALRPFALFGHYIDKEGLHQVFAIPERLETFVQTVNNYIALKHKPNSEKKVAVYYYKGPGQQALSAGSMEVGPSLYNLLSRMKREGYKIDNLPASSKALEKMIQEQGAVFGRYAQGAQEKFMRNGTPEWITKEQYEEWIKQAIRPEKYAEIIAMDGVFPGDYMNTSDGSLGIPRLQLGHVVLLPQHAAGKGDNSFKIVHGTDAAPPHSYVASYLWARYGFGADILIHFGTHGSLEFTPKKQVALCSRDWSDRLVGALPHFYIYTIGNVGEGMTAKRRSYAGLQSYLTPPFMESNLRGPYRELADRIKAYNSLDGSCSCGGRHEHKYNTVSDSNALRRASLAVKAATVKLGIHRELELDSLPDRPYSEADILRIENFAEELATEKIGGQLYTMGVPYENARIISSVYAMSTDPIAYSLHALDKLRGRVQAEVSNHRTLFTARYLDPARTLVGDLLSHKLLPNDECLCRIAGLSSEELAKARKIEIARRNPRDTTVYTKEDRYFSMAVLEVERTIHNVCRYEDYLRDSPELEMKSMINAMAGGYTRPSPGGDPIANPNTLPTGRNLFAINAEATPSEAAWEKGIQLAKNTIETYRRRHNDSIPRKVSYTLWSSEFIETEGATIAQVLYMLGVEPIRDVFGRVSDLKLIPSETLGRPRIDVVVQTSGQLRDLAASRLFLIHRAVEMAATAKDDIFENQVAAGVLETERTLLDRGLTPKDAREISTFRVFGGLNGGYGTGIQGMVMSGDRWENEKEIADTYLHNMGAYYGSEKNWEMFRKFAFEAALTRTDVVIHPRQSNTWGALSLDHVYEFMGGLNLSIRNVTGKDPDAYFSDYRNRHHVRMQELKEAIGVESRTTIFNPTYIKEQMKGEAGAAGGFAAIVQNTYGWNVMKPKVIDKELWDEIYQVYVKDKFNLGLQTFFETQNPAALEEITAVMLETVRKGLWKAGEQQIADMARLHVDLVNRHKPSCSGFVCDNAKLRAFIASKTDASRSKQYESNIEEIRRAAISESDKGVVMKKEEIQGNSKERAHTLSNVLVGSGVVIVILLLIFLVRHRRRKMKDGEWKR